MFDAAQQSFQLPSPHAFGRFYRVATKATSARIYGVAGLIRIMPS